MTKTLTIIAPDDFHVHFRDDERTEGYVREHARQFARALVMPNLRPKPIVTSSQAKDYFIRICDAVRELRDAAYHFEPLMTIQITPKTTPRTIKAAAGPYVRAAKLYPEGVTTNSDNGIRDMQRLYPVFEQMQDQGMVLCVHGEKPGYRVLDAEKAFIEKDLADIATRFPKLKITLEHASTYDAIQAVWQFDNVACTITAHHLEIILDDVVGHAGIQPHNFCKPLAKTVADRFALREAAKSDHPRIFFGSDSAPHLRKNKECCCGAAGCYTAPIAMALLATRFEEMGALDKLEGFTSIYGARWYDLPLNESKLTLKREYWDVPQSTRQGVTPFMAGHTLAWKVGGLSR